MIETRSAHPLALFSVAGDEAAMGRQHGELTRELGGWQPAVDFYPGLPGRLLGAGRRDRGRAWLMKALAPWFVAGTRRLDRARPDDLRARAEAFLGALGRPREERRHVFVLDVAQNTVAMLARLGLMHEVARLAPAGACSSAIVWGDASEDGRLLHARNFDLPGIGVWERAPTVVFCAPRRGLRYGFIATRGADVAGVTAFNETGIAISAHSRFHTDVCFDGLGVVDLGHRIAARATSLADAVAIASEHRVASSWGIVVSSARERRALAIETTAGRIGVHRPREGASHFAVTNRNRVPVMQTGEVAPSEAWVRYSDGREAVLERRLDGARGLGVDDLTALLSCHEAGDVPGWERSTGDCPAQSITIQSAVIDAERECVWVGVGGAPASKGPWVCVPWRWDRQGVSVIAAPTAAPARTAHELGYAAYVEAARLESIQGDEREVEAAMARALGSCADDPSYRQLAGGLALRAGRFDEALDHLEAALVTERSPWRIGELHRWSAIAARWAQRPGRAREHEGLVANPSKRWPSRRHREVGVDFQMLSLSL